MSRMTPPFDPARDEDEHFEVVPQDEPSLEDYPSQEPAAAESALIERETEWATEAEAEDARLREWGVK